MPLLSNTLKTRSAGRTTTSAGGAEEGGGIPAITFSRSVRPGCPRSGVYGELGKAHGRKHPRVPSGKWLSKDTSIEAVLVFLRSTRVGCISTRRKLLVERDEVWEAEAGTGDEREEGESGPP